MFKSHGDALWAEEKGGDERAIILVHGLGEAPSTWDATIDALPDCYRTLAPELRGTGRSERGTEPYTMDLLGDDLEALINNCRYEPRRITLVGHSLGGVIVQNVLCRLHATFEAAVLLSTSSRLNEKATANWRRIADVVEQKGLSTNPATIARGFSEAFAAANPTMLAQMAERNRGIDRKIYAEQARAASEYDFTEALGAVETPVLVLQGLEDQMTPVGGSVLLDRALGNSELELIEGAGHNLHLEMGKGFAIRLTEFIKRTESSCD